MLELVVTHPRFQTVTDVVMKYVWSPHVVKLLPHTWIFFLNFFYFILCHFGGEIHFEKCSDLILEILNLILGIRREKVSIQVNFLTLPFWKILKSQKEWEEWPVTPSAHLMADQLNTPDSTEWATNISTSLVPPAVICTKTINKAAISAPFVCQGLNFKPIK